MKPKSLGISAPAGEDVHEIYLKVKSRPSILGKISDVMKQRSIDILGVNAHVSDDKLTAYVALYVEMAGSTTDVGETIRTLRAQDYVLEATGESMKDLHYERVMFPLTSGGHYRVFVLGGTGWAALNRALLQTFGSGAEAILSNEGRAAGADIISGIMRDRRWVGRKSPPGADLLLANFIGLCRASGLGLLEVTRGDDKDDASAVRVEGSVLSEEETPMVDHFLVGLVAGAIGSIYRAGAQGFAVKDLKLEGKMLEFRLVSSEEKEGRRSAGAGS